MPVETRASAVVTARVPLELKGSVEAALRARGVSPSQAVRRMYEYIDRTDTLPAFIEADEEDEARVQRRQRAISHFRDNRLPRALSDDDVARLLDEERMARFA